MTLKSLLALVLGLVVVGHAPAASAQATDRAIAEELFRQGQTLMQAQRYAEACPKLAESQKLDPGTGTLLNLAVCHERQGKLATAWTEYSTVAPLSRRDNRPDRTTYAEGQLAAIEPKLSRLTIGLAPGADVPELAIALDGAPVGRPALGVAVPVDPGTHSVTASAKGKRPWEAKVEIPAEPTQKSVVVPPLENAPESEGAGAPASSHPAGGQSSKAEDKSDAGDTQRIIAYTLGGAGIVGVGIGAAFGLSAISKNSQSKDQGCVENQCTPKAAETRRSARSAGNVSTVAFIVGGAALAAGVVVYFTAPSAKKDEAAPTASARLDLVPGGGTLALGATW